MAIRCPRQAQCHISPKNRFSHPTSIRTITACPRTSLSGLIRRRLPICCSVFRRISRRAIAQLAIAAAKLGDMLTVCIFISCRIISPRLYSRTVLISSECWDGLTSTTLTASTGRSRGARKWCLPLLLRVVRSLLLAPVWIAR